jgi:hypothetical protein
MASKDLGNAAFFAIKGLKKELDDIKKRLDLLEQDKK